MAFDPQDAGADVMSEDDGTATVVGPCASDVLDSDS
jgi:hypothetical protein